MGLEDEKGLAAEEEKRIPIAKMVSSSFDPSISTSAATINQDSTQLKQNQNGSTSSPAPSSTKNTENIANNSHGRKAKSCKGCLYYSSSLKAGARNPICVGLARSLSNAPRYMVGRSDTEAASKEGTSLKDFRYGCVGYSIYTDRKENDEKDIQTEMPDCVGLEILIDRRVKTVDSITSPTQIHNIEDVNGFPPRRSPKPADSNGEEFFSRFTRNANVVANGVAKNARRVGNQIKHSLEDIMYPYRRPPK